MLDSIVSTLSAKKKSGGFCTKINTPIDDLALTVGSHGLVRFPISDRAAKSLIKNAKPSKFGRREKTLYDPSVRDVWEIPKNKIRIAQEKWKPTLELVLARIKRDLNLAEDGKLTAELHNMLIYEPGQFFTGHQDSEKNDGMMATLVVLLPSAFSGGTLVIDQQGDKQEFRAPRNSSNQLTFMAFYSDCHHEVKKVTQGYRIALTYNLIFRAPAKALAAKANNRLTEELKNYFSRSAVDGVPSDKTNQPPVFVYLLDHQYTQRSLGWQALKGADRIRVSEFISASEALGLTAHLALADIHETWDAESEDYWDQYDGYYDEEGDPEIDTAESDEYSLKELIEDDYELRCWVNRAGKSVRRAPLSVSRKTICWTKAVDEFEPFESEYEGYMGNYGNTLDRWYHRAAIVLWKYDPTRPNSPRKNSKGHKSLVKWR